MAHARQYHRQPMFIRGLDDLSIADGTSRLYDRRNPGLRCRIQSITEGKEGIRCHHATLYRHLRLHCRELDGIDPAHLAGTDPDRLTWLGIDNCVRLYMFADLPGEGTGCVFLVRRLTPRRD